MLSFIADALEDGFLQFRPPEHKERLFSRVAHGLQGMGRKLKSMFSTEARLRHIHTNLAALRVHHEDGAALNADERLYLASFIHGPLTRALNRDTPADLKSVARQLDDRNLRERLIAEEMKGGSSRQASEATVDANLEATRHALNTVHEHFDIAFADRSVLDASGQPDRQRVKKLHPALQIMFADTQLAPLVTAALRRGDHVSAQVLRRTPAYVTEDLREVARIIAGGSDLWIKEFLSSGRRPAITQGDVDRTAAALGKAVGGLEQLSARCQKAIEKKLDAHGIERLRAALSQPDADERAAALEKLAQTDGPRAREYMLLRGLSQQIEETRDADPAALLATTTDRLDRFDSFRDEGVRLRVHGVSQHAATLESALAAHPKCADYNRRIINETVGADYANESSEDAKKIIFGIAGLSLVGIPLEHYLGEGIMAGILSQAENVMGWLGQVSTMRGQGIDVKEIIGGWRNAGIVPVVALSTWGAGVAEKALWTSHGLAGALPGLGLGAASCGLTMYTTLSSYLLFRGIAKTMVKEGKVDLPSDQAYARQVVSQFHEPGLEAAFDDLQSRFQGTPDGRALCAALATRHHAVTADHFAAIAAQYNQRMAEHRTSSTHARLARSLRQGRFSPARCASGWPRAWWPASAPACSSAWALRRCWRRFPRWCRSCR